MTCYKRTRLMQRPTQTLCNNCKKKLAYSLMLKRAILKIKIERDIKYITLTMARIKSNHV